MKSNFKLLLFVFLNTIPLMVGNSMDKFSQFKIMAEKDSYSANNAINNNIYYDLANIPYDHFASREKPTYISFKYCTLSSPKVLTNETFANLTNIQYLDTLSIRHCGLTKLEEGTCDIFTTLAQLNLENNNFKSFDTYVNLVERGPKSPYIRLSYNPLEVFPREAIRSLNSSGKIAYLEASDIKVLAISKEEYLEIINSNVIVLLPNGIHCICAMKKNEELYERGNLRLYSICKSPPHVAGINTWDVKEKHFDYCNSTTLL